MTEHNILEPNSPESSTVQGAVDWPAERARLRSESRAKYIAHVSAQLTDVDISDVAGVAECAVDALTTWTRVSTGERCECGCHPRLPESDNHGFGFGCPCTKSDEEPRRGIEGWLASIEEFWSSEEGRAITARRQADETELGQWLASNPTVVVTSHGGAAPEQWKGSVDGHTFYFRERHEHWRIELDLRPTGRTMKVWVAGDLDDDASFEDRDVEAGKVIAEGSARAAGYGETPIDRIRFIVRTIRTHLGQIGCSTHTEPRRNDLRRLLGNELRWCPTCGTRLED